MERNKGDTQYTSLKDYSVDAIKGKNIAIHCVTQEEWDKVRAIMAPDNPDRCQTAYRTGGHCLSHDGTGMYGMSHCSKEWYENKRYQIIPASIFIAHNEKKEEPWVPKVGDYIIGKEDGIAPGKQASPKKVSIVTVVNPHGNETIEYKVIETGHTTWERNRYIRKATEEEIKKATRKLLSFKTEDGYDLYDGDIPIWVYRKDGQETREWYISTGHTTVVEGHKNPIGPRKLFHSKEAAEKWIETQNRILQKPKDEWKVGDKLPKYWLDKQDTYIYANGGKNPRKVFSSDREVAEVDPTGWARISNTSMVYLKPKKNYQDYDKTIQQEPWSIVCTDGVRVYAGEEVWWLSPNNTHFYNHRNTINADYAKSLEKGYKIFSTYEAAESYRQKQCGEVKKDPNLAYYNVGDWIYIINAGCRCSTYRIEEDGPCTIETGSVIQVLEIGDEIHHGAASYRTTGGWISGGKTNHRLVTNSEIPKKQCEPEYKVGDWVVWPNGSGEARQISKYNNATDWSVWYKGEEVPYSHNIYDIVRPATKEEIPVQSIGWKPGDRWRHRDAKGGKSIGQIGSDGMVDIDWGEFNSNNRLTVKQINELVESGRWIINPPEYPEYKEGQRVLVHNGANVIRYNGQEGVVVRLDKEHIYQPHITVKFEDGSEIYCYPYNDRPFNVEILPDTVEQQPVPERKWKIGDRFRVGSSIHELLYMDGDNVRISTSDKTGVNYTIEEVNKYWGKDWIPYNLDPIPVTKENAVVGMKVVRGKDWDYGEEDGGDGIGTIHTIGDTIKTTAEGWVGVQWEGDIEDSVDENYRIGYENKYDLYIAPEETITNNQPNKNTNNQKQQNNEKSISINSKEDNIYKGISLIEWPQEEIISTGTYAKGKSLSVHAEPDNISRGQRTTGTALSCW